MQQTPNTPEMQQMSRANDGCSRGPPLALVEAVLARSGSAAQAVKVGCWGLGQAEGSQAGWGEGRARPVKGNGNECRTVGEGKAGRWVSGATPDDVGAREVARGERQGGSHKERGRAASCAALRLLAAKGVREAAGGAVD